MTQTTASTRANTTLQLIQPEIRNGKSILIYLFCLQITTNKHGPPTLLLVQNSLQLRLELLAGFLQVINLLGVRLKGKHHNREHLQLTLSHLLLGLPPLPRLLLHHLTLDLQVTHLLLQPRLLHLELLDVGVHLSLPCQINVKKLSKILVREARVVQHVQIGLKRNEMS